MPSIALLPPARSPAPDVLDDVTRRQFLVGGLATGDRVLESAGVEGDPGS